MSLGIIAVWFATSMIFAFANLWLMLCLNDSKMEDVGVFGFIFESIVIASLVTYLFYGKGWV